MLTVSPDSIPDDVPDIGLDFTSKQLTNISPFFFYYIKIILHLFSCAVFFKSHVSSPLTFGATADVQMNVDELQSENLQGFLLQRFLLAIWVKFIL